MNKITNAISEINNYHYNETYRKLRKSHGSWLIYLYIFKFETINLQIRSSIKNYYYGKW